MSETFNFSRFWTYFKYDLKQMWRNHSKAAIMIGGAAAIFYIIWVMFCLAFTQHWSSPVIAARFIVLFLAFAVLEIYQTRTYGHLTEKQAGSAWLMVPASRTEKFVSMLLVTLVVIPVLFFTVYFLIDGFLSLVDPTYGQSLLTGFTGTYRMMVESMAGLENELPITVTPASFAFSTLVGFFCNFLYFLLCGICFKKNKIVGAIAILFGLSTVLSLMTGVALPRLLNSDVSLSDEQLAQGVTYLANGLVFLSCLLAIGLGWGIWRRIKTLQH